MSEAEVAAPSGENSAVLKVDCGPLARPLLCRVVAMMLARAHCPIDKLDDAMLICDAISSYMPEDPDDGHLRFTVVTGKDGLELRVGTHSAATAEAIVRDATLPDIGNVLEPISDELFVDGGEDGGPAELVLKLTFGRSAETKA